MKEASLTEARDLISAGALLVDVREQNEYEEVHAQDAQFMPLSDFEALHGTLPKDRPLVLICRSGARSARAAAFLLEQGYEDVTNLTGGTLAWTEVGLPVVRGGS